MSNGSVSGDRHGSQPDHDRSGEARPVQALLQEEGRGGEAEAGAADERNGCRSRNTSSQLEAHLAKVTFHKEG